MGVQGMQVFGSRAHGLALGSADLDVSFASSASLSPEAFLNRLQQTLTGCNNNNLCWEVSYFLTGNLAKLRLAVCEPTVEIRIGVDVTCREAVHTGAIMSHQIQMTSLSVLAALQPIVLLLKELLTRNSLNEAYTGGLSSFLLTLLVMTHIASRPMGHLSSLLVSFCEHYGTGDDHAVELPSVSGPVLLKDECRRWAEVQGLLQNAVSALQQTAVPSAVEAFLQAVPV